jgi:hypothetical protein
MKKMTLLRVEGNPEDGWFPILAGDTVTRWGPEMAKQFLEHFMAIYVLGSPFKNPNQLWTAWETQFTLYNGEGEEFIDRSCHTLAESLGLLGPDHPEVIKFFLVLERPEMKEELPWPPSGKAVRKALANRGSKSLPKEPKEELERETAEIEF